MVTVEDFSRLVASIYAAAVTPQHWEAAVREIQIVLDGTGGALLIPDGVSWYNSTLSVESGQAYRKYYYRLDRVAAAAERGPVGVVRTGTELMPLVRNSEFYDWLRPSNIDDALVVRLTSGARPACLIFGAPKRTESFDTRERVKLVGGLLPHLQQALRTEGKLAALANSTVELAGALEVVRHGIVIVAGEHRVINLNSTAEQIFRGEDGLCVRSGRIAATRTHAGQELHCAIQNALADESSTVRRGWSLTCFRPSGKRPYVIHVLPSPRCDAGEPPRQATALVLIIDPEDEPAPAAALLRRLYHLTEAEAEVALHVMHGADLKQISDELSISLTTVRTHLQHVFDKTDTHRQAELVRLLLALIP
jgi:DNA-binding CsgD family transcriptional regulator